MCESGSRRLGSPFFEPHVSFVRSVAVVVAAVLVPLVAQQVIPFLPFDFTLVDFFDKGHFVSS